MRGRWVLLLTAVVGVTAAAVSTYDIGRGSAASDSWVLQNLVKVARHEYPDFVGIQLIGSSHRGRIYWLAHRQYTDGRTLTVFRYRNGRIADLGSPGRALQVVAVNDHEQFVVDTLLPPAPFSRPIRIAPSKRPKPKPLPPVHSYLWQPGKLTDLGSLGGDTAASAINNRGQIIGSSQIGKGLRAPWHAFLWQDGKMTDLGSLGGRGSSATAINDHGQVIGTSDIGPNKHHGFLWEHGKMIDLGTLGGWTSDPIAINERAQVIGQSTTPNGTAHRFLGQAFVWQNGKMAALGTLNLRGYPLACQLNTTIPRCQHPCPHPRAGCPYWHSVVSAINNNGEIVGTSETNVGVGRAFLWRNGKLTDLGTLGGRTSKATAINDIGQIVGWSDTRLVPYTAQQVPRPRPFLWQNGKLTELPTDFASPTQTTAINPSGTEILGTADWPGHQALLWTPTRP